MGSWIRIILVAFVLIGGTTLFGFWSLSQFRIALDNLNASYLTLANALSAGVSQRLDNTSASTSPGTLEVVATSTDPAFSLVFPQEKDGIYIGCTYRISWQSSTTVESLGMSLVDAATLKPTGSTESGLNATSTKTGSGGLEWKVGNILPGEYYLEVSELNDQKVAERSGTFPIRKIPNGEKQGSFCKLQSRI